MFLCDVNYNRLFISLLCLAQGFGGKFGVETDRVDKSALPFNAQTQAEKSQPRERPRPDIGGAKPSSLRAHFENMAKEKEQVTWIVLLGTF